jgi:hypothetical protein
MTEVTKGLLVRLKAKPGKEGDVESFLEAGGSIVEGEPRTTAWFAVRLGDAEFGIFDVVPDDSGRQAHLSGVVAQALQEQGPELFDDDPTIEPVDVIASKLPS